MIRTIATCLTSMLAAAVAFASTFPASPAAIPATIVVMDFPDALGGMQRPAVEFDHELHADAYEGEGCTTCHARDEAGRLVPALDGTVALKDRDELIEAYHDRCIGCHEQRASSSLDSGPVTCGGCHVKLPPRTNERADMRFDYSLHARHVKAAGEKCEACHHVWDEEAQRLRYEKGAEEACRVCHLERAVDDSPSLEYAAHLACVSCHLERAERATDVGPVRCAGCHDPEAQALYVELEDVPRLVRGQPDLAWVHHREATYPAVPFDHRVHEPEASFCSDCHHQTLAACDSCHTLVGSPDGAGVTLAEAYHDERSGFSCVGCHRAVSTEGRCAGCHAVLDAAASDRSCSSCHSGPVSQEQVESSEPAPERIVLEPLPPTSDDYPETVTIDVLAADYEPSRLPHAKIVAALDTAVRDSGLAARFHGDRATLCAGCHHHSPIGVRPPACRTCHAETADPVADRPGLKVAYHRQCIGCHIELNIPERGCTDCHRAKEVHQ